MPLRPLVASVIAATLIALCPQLAKADVRRCVTASGQTIFTDRRCAEIDAVERVPREPAKPDAHTQRAAACARSLQDLVFAMSSAIDARDANRLASVYHWPGVSADSGYRIWMRLDAIANRPLVDIVPVMAASESASDSADATVDPNLYPQTSVGRNPVALRLEQTVGSSATPARTVFGLTHYFGCWWVRF